MEREEEEEERETSYMRRQMHRYEVLWYVYTTFDIPRARRQARQQKAKGLARREDCQHCSTY
jgi:hypothetical protein